MNGFAQFVHKGRVAMSFDGMQVVRAVYQAEIIRKGSSSTLEDYMADRTPYFYREPRAIAEKFEEGHFLSALRSVLLRIPTALSFKESHFGEIISAVYAEEILQLRRLYSSWLC